MGLPLANGWPQAQNRGGSFLVFSRELFDVWQGAQSV